MLYHKSHLSDLPSVSQITHVQSPMSAFKAEHSIFFPRNNYRPWRLLQQCPGSATTRPFPRGSSSAEQNRQRRRWGHGDAAACRAGEWGDHRQLLPHKTTALCPRGAGRTCTAPWHQHQPRPGPDAGAEGRGTPQRQAPRELQQHEPGGLSTVLRPHKGRGSGSALVPLMPSLPQRLFWGSDPCTAAWQSPSSLQQCEQSRRSRLAASPRCHKTQRPRAETCAAALSDEDKRLKCCPPPPRWPGRQMSSDISQS